MRVIKFTWEKTDTFQDIHKKLLKMKGAKVVNKQNKKAPFTIFDVGKIEEMELSGIGDGFIKFLEGDEKYQTKDGGYNFRGMKIMPMWGFTVKYGIEYENGNISSTHYQFMIPRKDTYKKDVKATTLVVDKNHPFVFYSFKEH